MNLPCYAFSVDALCAIAGSMQIVLGLYVCRGSKPVSSLKRISDFAAVKVGLPKVLHGLLQIVQTQVCLYCSNPDIYYVDLF